MWYENIMNFWSTNTFLPLKNLSSLSQLCILYKNYNLNPKNSRENVSKHGVCVCVSEGWKMSDKYFKQNVYLINALFLKFIHRFNIIIRRTLRLVVWIMRLTALIDNYFSYQEWERDGAIKKVENFQFFFWRSVGKLMNRERVHFHY